MRRETYTQKCMKCLTFLDYSALENQGKSIEAKLEENELQLQRLEAERATDRKKLTTFQSMLMELKNEIDKLKRQIHSP